MQAIEKEVRSLQQVFSDLARQAAPEDKDVYRCPLCRDTGFLFQGDRVYPCNCQKATLLREKKIQAGIPAPLQRMTFQSFDLLRYAANRKTPDGKTYRKVAETAFLDAQHFVAHCSKKPLPYRGLLLEGDVGCGKTHLAVSIASALIEKGIDCLFTVVPELLDDLRASYRRENEGLDEIEIIKRTYQTPVLILDDLGAHNYTDWVCNKLFTIINHRYNRGLPCVITTNLSMNDLEEKIGDRATSRIYEMCKHYAIYSDRDLRLTGARV